MRKYLLEIAVFLCGALVMTYEIIGSRILSPHIGTSTYTWTSLIGVILASLSLGYWLGGKWADKKPDIKILASAIFLAGGLVAITILFKDSVLSVVAQTSLPIELKAVFASIILFSPASVFLGFVTPYAVKLKTETLDKTGETVGRLYALSTVGSILGTFLAGFFLIPFVGSTRTLYIIAGSLIGLSVLLAPFAISRSNVGILVIFAIGIGFNEIQAVYLRQVYNFHDIDTEYSRVQVFDATHKTDGKPIRAMRIDPKFFQSSMYLDSDELTSEYAKFYHLVRYYKPDFKKTLMIGGAGYSFPKDYLTTYPEAEMDVVEIDPQMTAIAKRFFRLEEYPRLKITHEDGRVFLNHAPAAEYDAVFLDAFTTLFNVPFQLTTIEAVREIHRVLKDDGVVIFNLGGVIEGKGSGFFKAEIKTYKEVFDEVVLFKVDQSKSDSDVQNLIILAAKQRHSPEGSENPDPQTEQLLNNKRTLNFTLRNPLLTDDLAPTEFYNSQIRE
ncbi:MAG: fused MFS/spermidine synthase [Pyrinomonadaceae bacterium]